MHMRLKRLALLAAFLPALTLAAETSRTPAHWESAIQAFEQADRQHPVPSGGIVFVGSSSIRRWDLKKSFPETEALNRGFGGSYLSDVAHFFDRIVKPYRPRLVVLYAGDNDLAAKRTPEQVHESFQNFLAQLKQKLPETRLVYISIKPSIKRWNLIEAIRQANSLIKADCEKEPMVEYIDVDGPMLGSDGQPRPELFAADGLHLSDEGYRIWADLVRPYVDADARLRPLRILNDNYHSWSPPATLEEWEREAERLREQVLVACGLWPMPAKEELKPTIHGLVDRGDYTIERVYFASLPGHYVTGSLYRPKGISGRVPGVLCPHGHWPEGRFQDAGPAEAQKRLQTGAEEFLSGARYSLQARMVELVRMGCVVFHYDMIGVADNGPLGHRTGFSDAQSSLWLHSKLGLQTWNSIRAFDFIEHLPDVDPNRIAVTGASGGGTQTFLLCAVDPRPAVAFPAVMVSTGMQGGCICENADYLRQGINNIALAALMAPRPLGMSAARDWTIDLETRGLPELKQVYDLYGKADLVMARVFSQFSHNYNQVSREVMYNWFNEHLGLGLADPIRQTDFWPLTRDEMTVFDAEHPRPADALEEPALREELRNRDRQQFLALLDQPGDYQRVIGTAARVMLAPPAGAVQIESEQTPASDPSAKRQNVIVRCEGARIPLTVLLPKSPTGKVVLWLDGAGAKHLTTEGGNPESTVQQLLDQGLAVASADLFLTGETVVEPNPYIASLSKISPSHVPAKEGEDYTGFTYGYNHPLISERVRDVLVVAQALRQMNFTEFSLVGTGDAGPWVLLARGLISEAPRTRTIVDLGGFSFDQISRVQDQNMLPGALKYGGIGGLAAIGTPGDYLIAGVTEKNSGELQPLLSLNAARGGTTAVRVENLSRADVVKALLPAAQ